MVDEDKAFLIGDDVDQNVKYNSWIPFFKSSPLHHDWCPPIDHPAPEKLVCKTLCVFIWRNMVIFRSDRS